MPCLQKQIFLNQAEAESHQITWGKATCMSSSLFSCVLCVKGSVAVLTVAGICVYENAIGSKSLVKRKIKQNVGWHEHTAISYAWVRPRSTIQSVCIALPQEAKPLYCDANKSRWLCWEMIWKAFLFQDHQFFFSLQSAFLKNVHN